MRTVRPHPRFALLLAFACVLIGACANDVETPDVVPLEVRFDPPAGPLQVLAYATLDLRVFDGANDPVEAEFFVEGQKVATDTEYAWVAESPGSFTLRAVVTVGARTFEAEWTVQVSEEAVQAPQSVAVLSMRKGARPGSILFHWETPPSLVPTERYVVGLSAQPITPETFDQTDLHEFDVADSVLLQTHLIENLVEEERYYGRVRAIDRLQRSAPLSPERTSKATGHFDVSGSVRSLQLGADVKPQAGVLVEIGPHRLVTAADGRFELLGLPDLLREPLRIREQDGNQFYDVVVNTIAASDTIVDMTLFAREFVPIADPPDGFPELMTQREFLYHMTRNNRSEGGFVPRLYRWDDYPVQMQVTPFQRVGKQGEVVDYGLAFQRGIDAWNEAAGETLIVAVTETPSVGAVYTLGLRGGLLGSVNMSIPAGGIFNAVPQILVMELAEFNTQSLADRVIAHELGHVLLLDHSPSADHLMELGVTSTTDPRPTRDEAYMARLVRHLPQRIPLDWIVEP